MLMDRRRKQVRQKQIKGTHDPLVSLLSRNPTGLMAVDQLVQSTALKLSWHDYVIYLGLSPRVTQETREIFRGDEVWITRIAPILRLKPLSLVPLGIHTTTAVRQRRTEQPTMLPTFGHHQGSDFV